MASERDSLQGFSEDSLSSLGSLAEASDVEIEEPMIADAESGDTEQRPPGLGASEWQIIDHRSLSQCGSTPRSLSQVDLLESPARFESEADSLDDSSASEGGDEMAHQMPELLMRQAELMMAPNTTDAVLTPAASNATSSVPESSPDFALPPSLAEDKEIEMEAGEVDKDAQTGSLLSATESASETSSASAPALSGQSSFASISVPSEGAVPPEVSHLSPFSGRSGGSVSSRSINSLTTEEEILPDTGVCSVVTGYPLDSVFRRSTSRPASFGSQSDYARLSDESPLPSPGIGRSGSMRSSRSPQRPANEGYWARWVGAAGSTQAGRMLKQMWGTLQAYARRLGAVIPPKLRARIQRLLACLEVPHFSGEKGQPRLLLSAFVAVSVLLAITCVKNRSLARSLQARDSELQHHILMVLDLNNKLTNAVDIPIMRHTAFRSSLSLGSTVF